MIVAAVYDVSSPIGRDPLSKAVTDWR